MLKSVRIFFKNLPPGIRNYYVSYSIILIIFYTIYSLLPFLYGIIIDAVIESSLPENLILLYIILSVLSIVLFKTFSLINVILKRKIADILSLKIFQANIDKSITDSSCYLINKSEALEVFGDFVFTIPCHIIVVVFILIISFFYSYLVGIVYILSIIVYLINANLTNKKSYPKYELVQKNSEKLYILYDQYASNHIDFFINNYTKYPIKKLETVCDVKKKNNEKYIASKNFYGMNGILNEQMASILVIVICIYLFFYKNLSFGSVIMLTAFSDVIITSFSYLYNNYSFLKNISYHTNIINKHLERENPINNLSYVPNSNLLIDIRDLTIGYSNDKPLLKNICLNGNSSQIILIKGTSGIGKSTLFKTIANQISSINGNIIIREGTKIIYVDDEDYIFNRTLRENIDFLDPSINITDIENNMQLFLLDELICRLNDNLEENGQLISGGEKNRISLIRSVLANADLILLDEPLKSVDDAIKKKIASKLRNIFKDKCCLIITHGDVFDEYCDKILHMEDFI